ncbi:MAG TPA: hypothetical protein VM533_21360 [Fimbriiglobus sp.]|nr:hypothetical protein [Fimbriiglobus sp.]
MDPIPQIPPPPAPPQYEFDEEQNHVIDDLAASMRWATLPLFLLGVVGLFATALQVNRALTRGEPAEWCLAGAALIQAVVLLWLGRRLANASAAFDRVTATTRYDITHLMTGLRHQQMFFCVFRVVIQVMLVLLVFAVVALLTALVGRSALGT